MRHTEFTAHASCAAGDRHLPIDQRYPAAAFYHAGMGGRVLDVTQPPFNARGDGVTDDTQALIAALRFVRDHYALLRGADFSYCSQKYDRNWVVYLPDGEYLVSDTVSQGWPALAMHILQGWSHVAYLRVASPEHEEALYAPPAAAPLLHGNPATPAGDDNQGRYLRGPYNDAAIYAETNWAIRVIGQSRDRTIIRLRDAAPGFGADDARAVVALYLLQRGSNVNLGNYLENLTIETGRGNPGAIGLRWNASNWGGVRNVAIRAGDGRGRVGLLTDASNATGYHHDLLIEGFDTGMEIAAGRETMVTLEYATFAGQREAAIRLGDARAGGGGDSLSARKLLIRDAPVALRAGRAGQAILLESTLTARREQAAALVVAPDGFLLARDVRLDGYRAAVTRHGPPALPGGDIDLYCSAAPVRVHAAPVRLPVKDAPVPLPEPELSQWASVDAFGAAGDGITDDTAAIQRAMRAGAPVVYFPRATYVVNGTVDIPASVRELAGGFAAVYRVQAGAPDGPALFRVAEPSARPLFIRQATSAGGVFVDHEADRPLVLDDIYVVFNHVRDYADRPDMLFPRPAAQDTETWRLYRNTRPAGAAKEVFVNSCVGFSGENAAGTLALEHVNVWARMINTEHLPALYAFRRAAAWIFGFKSEGADTLLKALEHTRLEVLGGSFLTFDQRRGPVIDCRDSQVAAVFYQWHRALAAPTIWQGISDGVTTEVPSSAFPALAQVDGAVIYLA